MNLDLEKLLGTQKIYDLVERYLIPWGINIILALVIFILGRIVAGVLIRVFRKVMSRSRFDQMIIDFLASILGAVLLLLVIIASLDQLGVDTTSMIAILGAAGLAIGLALQGSLKNFAAGVLLLVFRPFKAGDYIEAAGTAGTVKHITIFNTIMTSVDNKEITVPNGNIYEGNIVNYSANATRRVDMVFGIGYESDLRQAKQILTELVEADERILDDPAPRIAVDALADSSVNFMVRPWVATPDVLAVKTAFTEAVKLRFDEVGISIPFPQLDLHMIRDQEEREAS